MCSRQDFKSEWVCVQISARLLINCVTLRQVTYFSALKFTYLLIEGNISFKWFLSGINHFKYVKYLKPTIYDTQ